MRRTIGLLVFALCLLVPVTRTPEAAVRERFLHPLIDSGGCKPGAPVAVDLFQTGARDGSIVELQFEITPRVDFDALSWRLDLPEGAQLLDGAGSGTLAAGRAGSGPQHARVRLPSDTDSTRIALIVDGRLSGSAPDALAGRGERGPPTEERVQSRRALSWGRATLPVSERRMVDPDTGETERLAILSVRHRRGR